MKTPDFDTIRWSCTAGVNSGYDLATQEDVPLEYITELYQNIAAQVYEQTGIYISAVITSSQTVYHSEWGCPAVGEFTYTFSGSCNPEFADPEKFKNALLIMAEKLKDALKQKTLLIEIIPAHLIYLK